MGGVCIGTNNHDFLFSFFFVLLGFLVGWFWFLGFLFGSILGFCKYREISYLNSGCTLFCVLKVRIKSCLLSLF